MLLRARSGSGNYAYVSARIKARKTKLIPPEEYPRLLSMDVHSLARFLQEGAYHKEIDELSPRFRGSALVERAGRVRLSKEYREILRMCTGELREKVSRYLERYDVYNVKTILRGKFSASSEEEILSTLIPAGTLGVEDLSLFVRIPTLSELVEELKRTPYGSALQEVPEAESGLARLENEIDRLYYRRVLESFPSPTEADRAFREFLSREIDVLNLKTLVRTRLAGIEDVTPFLLTGGKALDLSTLRRLARSSPSDIAREIAPTWAGRCSEAIQRSLETGDLHPAVTALDRSLRESARSFSQRYPLSILPVADYLFRLKDETDALRILALGKARGLSEEVLRPLVVIP